ncbi:MAG: hypothetical protein F4X09_10965 [Gammaproteobacteria bacterium]|nr:hypothetical protein [Gammaproteobacteria bacterium]MYC60694.1 hypothetical protein [Gammaproteobacteria bacterium]MYH47551.1 hypothetical protein [Gammaproteobacteria bacterium]MYL12266.1 hypothetical protein [Gammaproteobacteria bacterium]
MIVQNRDGETMDKTLHFETGENGSIIPISWTAKYARAEELSAAFTRFFPLSKTNVIEEQPARNRCSQFERERTPPRINI